MPFYTFRTENMHEIFPNFHAQFVHSDHMTVGSWEIEAGNELPEHAHPDHIGAVLDYARHPGYRSTWSRARTYDCFLV